MIRHTILSIALAILLFLSAAFLLAAGLFFSGVCYPFDTDGERAKTETKLSADNE